MSDNSTSSSNSSSSGGADPGTIVSYVALVISVVALLGTIAQVLQQYYASAAGYSNCGESVMGKWHQSKKRIFRATELRFEVQFEAPVLFVCPPDNTRGPVKTYDKIHFVEGTDKSLVETRALPSNEEAKQSSAIRSTNVHTADNERATWVTLLSELQAMEKESREWQAMQYKRGPPDSKRQATFQDHGLAVALQPKTRSWDTMPTGVQKPYATTTMCHLLEICAMLGIYWQEFDRSRDRYRAEGNGYMVLGHKVADLGIMFTFQLCGKSKFQENRVIPAHEVKELCCGTVSTIFRRKIDDRMLEPLEESGEQLEWLHMGSKKEIAESLVLIGCNNNTANYLRSDQWKHSHLFPVPLELVGMLGKTMHIRNTCFRMVPNPTPFCWDKKFFSLRRMMKEYRKKLEDDDVVVQTEKVERLADLAQDIERTWAERSDREIYDYDLPRLEKLHDALDEIEKYLKDPESVSRELVTLVLREHFQLVLKMINEPGETETRDDDSVASDRRGNQQHHATRFDELNAASPEERQAKFMDIYFSVVLPKVMERAVSSFNRRRSTRYAPSTHGREPSASSAHSVAAAFAGPTGVAPTVAGRNTGRTNKVIIQEPPSSPGLPVTPTTPQPPSIPHAESSGSIPLLQVEAAARGARQPLTAQNLNKMDTSNLEKQVTNIWCTLVFRMLCWLMLHDFHKRDVQLPKSELLGSRMPVYIS